MENLASYWGIGSGSFLAQTPAIPVDAIVSELLQLAVSQSAIELETVDPESSSDPAVPMTDQSGESE